MSKDLQPKKKFNWWWIIIGVIAIVLLVQLTMPHQQLKDITLDTLRDNLGVTYSDETGNYKKDSAHPNTVYGVYKVENEYYIMYLADYNNLELKERETVDKDPTLIQQYASAKLYDNSGLAVAVLAACPDVIVASGAAPVDWIDYIIPLVYVGLAAVAIFILWRSMAGKGGVGGLAAMTHNRAQIIINCPTRFSDVAGIDEEKEQVAEIVDFLRHPKKYVDMGARIPKGVLLVGQPGTGKTLLAKAIAGEAGVPFFSLSGSDFSEMLVGVGPARMRDLFMQARVHAPAIIFLDELDSIARMRGVGASGVAEENEQTLNQLLVQMDGFAAAEGVIVLAATNRPDVLDPAILRPGRFDRQIIVQVPDVKGREKILEVHAKNKPVQDLDLHRIAQITSGFTGADLENLLNESAIIAAKDNRKAIAMTDVLEGINKVIMGPQKRSRIITDDDKRITAYHESGHAVVSRILAPEQTVQEVSIVQRGMAAGYTLTNEDNENHHQSLSKLNNRLTMLLGGRCAEQIFIGDISAGASNDIKVATELAENMVTKWGMSEKLGPLYYGKEDEVALRIAQQKQISEAVQATIDSEIRALITNAVTRCQKILRDNAAKVKAMAELLLANETINSEDIAMIMDGKKVADISKLINARRDHEKAATDKAKIDALLAELEPKIAEAMKVANLLLHENLASPEHVARLMADGDIAREFVRKYLQLPPVFPTIDSAKNGTYAAEIQKAAPVVKETPKTTPKRTAPKTEVKKAHAETKKDAQSKQHE